MNSDLFNEPKTAVPPSDRIVFNDKILSRVTPYLIEVDPEELFPTIPPIIHLFVVEVSGPKKYPYGLKKSLSSSRITPG